MRFMGFEADSQKRGITSRLPQDSERRLLNGALLVPSCLVGHRQTLEVGG